MSEYKKYRCESIRVLYMYVVELEYCISGDLALLTKSLSYEDRMLKNFGKSLLEVQAFFAEMNAKFWDWTEVK